MFNLSQIIRLQTNGHDSMNENDWPTHKENKDNRCVQQEGKKAKAKVLSIPFRIDGEKMACRWGRL